MESSLYEIVKLLLVSSTFGPLDELLDNKIITWDTKSVGLYMYIHMMCMY